MRKRFKLGDRVVQVDLLSRQPLHVNLVEDTGEEAVCLQGTLDEGEGHLQLGDRYVAYFVTEDKGGVWVTLAGHTWFFEKARKGGAQEAGHGGFGAPMPGKVIKVLVSKGEEVAKGEVLVIMEAMKMEHRIEAPSDGIIKAVHCVADQLVDHHFELLEFEAAE